MSGTLLAIVVVTGLASSASAALPDFDPPSPRDALAAAGEAPAVQGAPEARVIPSDFDGWSTREHTRSKPRHRFDLASINGSYRLAERSDPAKGCIDPSRKDDDVITIEYDQRVSRRSWAPDDHYESLNVRTPQDYVLDFVADIDQGPMQYTRRDVENPTLGDVVGCVAWFSNLGIGDAYRYCRDSVLPKRRPEPDFNPSYSYREETRTTADGEVVSESLRVVRPTRDVTVASLKTTSLALAGATLTVVKQVQEGGSPVKTLQRCVYRRQ